MAPDKHNSLVHQNLPEMSGQTEWTLTGPGDERSPEAPFLFLLNRGPRAPQKRWFRDCNFYWVMQHLLKTWILDSVLLQISLPGDESLE